MMPLFTWPAGTVAVTPALLSAVVVIGFFAFTAWLVRSPPGNADPTVLTCIANDFELEDLFARQVRAFVGQGDVVVGFTTSGSSANVVRGLAAGKGAGATTVLFGGGTGMPAAEHADLKLVVPSDSTARVQEMHVLLLHLVLEQVDAWAAAS